MVLEELDRETEEIFSIAKTAALQNPMPQEEPTAETLISPTRDLPESLFDSPMSRSISKRRVAEMFDEEPDRLNGV